MTPHRCGHTLANLVDPLRLNADAPRVIVGAINVATGLMEYFRGGQPGGLTFEHVAASGSLPPSFPMTTIGHHRYCDGGLFSHTPLGPAINALEQAAGGDRAMCCPPFEMTTKPSLTMQTR